MNSYVPFKLRGVDHVVVRVSDLEGMVAFYCDVLGCVLERGPGEARLAQLRAGRSLIDLVDVSGPFGGSGRGPDTERANMDHFCVLVDPWEPERMLLHLRKHRVDVGEVVVRYGASGLAPSAYVSDPEGNTVELRAAPTVDGAAKGTTISAEEDSL